MEIFETIIEYASIWVPSLVAILGMVLTFLKVVGQLKSAMDSLKADKTLSDTNAKLSAVIADNAELIRVNKLLLDELTKIKDYADIMKKG